jgi:hypothetical protein
MPTEESKLNCELPAVREFVQDAMKLIKRDIGEHGVPKRGGAYVKFGERTMETGAAVYEDFLPVVDKFRDEFKKMTSAQAAIESGVRLQPETSKRTDQIHDLIGILSDLTLRHGVIATEEQETEVNSQHIRSWQRGTIDLQLEAIVLGVSSSVDQFDIASDVSLSLLTADRKTKFWNEDAVHFSLMQLVRANEMMSANHLLSITEKFPRGDIPNLLSTSNAKLVAAISALRLCLDGRLGVVAIRNRCVPKPSMVTCSAINPPPSEIAVNRIGSDCNFDIKTAQSIRKTYARLSDPSVSSSIQLAIRRFNQSFERQLLEDAVVDLAICTEATLLIGIDQGESALRMRLLGAALIGSEVSDNDEILKELSKARNGIVHAGKVLQDIFPKSRPVDVVARIRQLVRRILISYLDRTAYGNSIEDVNLSLLNQVFSALESKLD